MSTEEISSLVALKLSYCSPVNMETEINANKSKNSSSNEQKMAQDLTGTTLPGTHNENDEPSSNESIDEKPKEMELHSSYCSPKPLEFEFSDDLTPASDEVDTGETDIDGLSLSGSKPKYVYMYFTIFQHSIIKGISFTETNYYHDNHHHYDLDIK